MSNTEFGFDLIDADTMVYGTPALIPPTRPQNFGAFTMDRRLQPRAGSPSLMWQHATVGAPGTSDTVSVDWKRMLIPTAAYFVLAGIWPGVRWSNKGNRLLGGRFRGKRDSGRQAVAAGGARMLSWGISKVIWKLRAPTSRVGLFVTDVGSWAAAAYLISALYRGADNMMMAAFGAAAGVVDNTLRRM